jgi:hypothetical protein
MHASAIMDGSIEEALSLIHVLQEELEVTRAKLESVRRESEKSRMIIRNGEYSILAGIGNVSGSLDNVIVEIDDNPGGTIRMGDIDSRITDIIYACEIKTYGYENRPLPGLDAYVKDIRVMEGNAVWSFHVHEMGSYIRIMGNDVIDIDGVDPVVDMIEYAQAHGILEIASSWD